MYDKVLIRRKNFPFNKKKRLKVADSFHCRFDLLILYEIKVIERSLPCIRE